MVLMSLDIAGTAHVVFGSFVSAAGTVQEATNHSSGTLCLQRTLEGERWRNGGEESTAGQDHARANGYGEEEGKGGEDAHDVDEFG